MPTGLDTNILIYTLMAQDDKKHRIAVALLERILSNPHEYKISVQVLAEVIYVIARKAPEVLPEAVKLVELLSNNLEVVYYTSNEIIQASNGSSKRFWDRLLAHTYRNNGVTRIITEDEKPYKGILEVVNPF